MTVIPLSEMDSTSLAELFEIDYQDMPFTRMTPHDFVDKWGNHANRLRPEQVRVLDRMMLEHIV